MKSGLVVTRRHMALCQKTTLTSLSSAPPDQELFTPRENAQILYKMCLMHMLEGSQHKLKLRLKATFDFSTFQTPLRS